MQKENLVQVPRTVERTEIQFQTGKEDKRGAFNVFLSQRCASWELQLQTVPKSRYKFVWFWWRAAFWCSSHCMPCLVYELCWISGFNGSTWHWWGQWRCLRLSTWMTKSRQQLLFVQIQSRGCMLVRMAHIHPHPTVIWVLPCTCPCRLMTSPHTIMFFEGEYVPIVSTVFNEPPGASPASSTGGEVEARQSCSPQQIYSNSTWVQNKWYGPHLAPHPTVPFKWTLGLPRCSE